MNAVFPQKHRDQNTVLVRNVVAGKHHGLVKAHFLSLGVGINDLGSITDIYKQNAKYSENQAANLAGEVLQTLHNALPYLNALKYIIVLYHRISTIARVFFNFGKLINKILCATPAGTKQCPSVTGGRFSVTRSVTEKCPPVTLSKASPFFLTPLAQKEPKTPFGNFARCDGRLGTLSQDPAPFLKKGRSKTFINQVQTRLSLAKNVRKLLQLCVTCDKIRF